MGNKMKKLICALLASAMVISSVGIVSFADEVTPTNAPEVTATEAPSASPEATEAPTDAPEATPEATAVPEATESPSAPSSTYDSDKYYQKSLALCSSLGIITGYEDGSVKPDSNVTRAEMASIVLRMLAIDSHSQYQNAFKDVTSAHWAANQIQTAMEQKIISGMGDGTFVPDGEVTYAQVLVMLVNALNYNYEAEAAGGWTSGYLQQADILDITKSVQGAVEVPSTRGEVIKMVYNSLLADYKEITGYENGNPKYEAKRTLAEAKFDVIEAKGVLKGTAKTDITGTDIQENQIEILKDGDDNAEVYDCILTGLEDYLAQKITYYYRENKGRMPEVLAVSNETAKSDTYEITDVTDIEKVEGFDTDEGKIKLSGVGKAKDCKGATIVYNGKTVTDSEKASLGEGINDLLKPELGTVKLVKSTKNSSSYDIVFVDSYETVVVSSAGAENLVGKISDATADDIGATKAYSLRLDDSVDRVITVKKGDSEARLRNLKKNDVASIKRSLDNTVVDIVVTGESIVGSASGVTKKLDNTKATINGEKYDVANIAVNDLKAGTQSTFYLDMFGRVAFIESAGTGQLQSGEKYGWLMDAYESENGDDYVVKIMTSDGKEAELNAGTNLDYWGPKAADSETLKGDAVAETISALFAKKADGTYNDELFIIGNKTNTPIRLVKYKANGSGTLSRLYCAVNASEVSDTNAVRVNPSDLNGVAVVASLVGGYKINDGMMEISVPRSSADMKNADNYKFGTANSSVYVVRENGSTRNYVLGEFDSSNTPTVLINFTASADALANLGDIDTNGNNPVMVVDEIDVGYDDEDNTVYTVRGFVNGAEATFTTTKNTVLSKIDTRGALIDNARDYSVTKYCDGQYIKHSDRNKDAYKDKLRDMWDAQHGANDGTGRSFEEILTEGDVVLYDTGERLIQLFDADDVYNVVQKGESKAGMLFGSYNPFPARNMFAFGALIDSDLSDEARIEIDTSALNNIEFDPNKLMDTVEINIKNGSVAIDTEGSEISDLINYDPETKTGDYIFARFADKGTLQEIIVYRFVD